jgi:hypothetical protein
MNAFAWEHQSEVSFSSSFLILQVKLERKESWENQACLDTWEREASRAFLETAVSPASRESQAYLDLTDSLAYQELLVRSLFNFISSHRTPPSKTCRLFLSSIQI